MPRRLLEHVQMRQIIQWFTEWLTQREVGFSQCCKSQMESLYDEWYSCLYSYGRPSATPGNWSNNFESSVSRRLHMTSMRTRRRTAYPPLTRELRVSRWQWAEEHQNWNINEWRMCLFSDKSRFCLTNRDWRILV